MGFLSRIGGVAKKAGTAASKVTNGFQNRLGKIQNVANRASGLVGSVQNVTKAGGALKNAANDAKGVFSRRGP